MVKKLVLKLDNDNKNIISNFVSFEDLNSINNNLNNILTNFKNKITEYYKNRSWDKYKKLSNEYEMIYNSPNYIGNISKYSPVSRSFFKLWEILEDFKCEIDIDKLESITAVFIAEGPGGFTEALLKNRNNKNDNYYGITLKSNNNKNIPDWKIQNSIFKNLKICYGKDGSGDIFNFENIIYFINYVGKNKSNFITADGGFDFSSDFNNQEEQSLLLLLCEVYIALNLQKKNGIFLLKIYDCFNENTIKLIQILNLYYKNIYFIKPLTSRPANSERYLLCCNFNDIHNDNILKNLEYNIKNYKQIIDFIELDLNIYYNVICYNYYYTIRQIYYIQRTINYINFFKDSNKDKDKIIDLTNKNHINKCIKWCKKYNLEYKEII